MANFRRSLTICCIAFMATAWVQADEIVSVDEENPPFMYRDHGRPVGVYPDLLNEASRRMNHKLQIVALPWKRALMKGEHGESGVGGLYKSADRLSKYDFSDKIIDEELQIFVRRDQIGAFSDLSSLEGKIIGVIRGWSYGAAFDEAVKGKKLTVEEVTGDSQNFAKLLAGRVDAVIAVRESAEATGALHQVGKEVVALPEILVSSPTFLAFAKSAHKQAVIQDFNVAMAAMRSDGSFERITRAAIESGRNAWFHSD